MLQPVRPGNYDFVIAVINANSRNLCKVAKLLQLFCIKCPNEQTDL